MWQDLGQGSLPPNRGRKPEGYLSPQLQRPEQVRGLPPGEYGGDDLRSKLQAASARGAPAQKRRPARAGRGAWALSAARGRSRHTFRSQLCVLCTTEGRTGRECLAEALNDLFKKYGRPPIA